MGCNRPTGVADATLSGAARLSARHSRHQQRTRHQCTAATAAWLAGLLLMALALGHGVAAPTSATSTASASAAAGSRAAAQPCIECSQCLTASCQRICSSSCRGGRVPAANAALVNSDQCRYMGEEAADAVAGSACRAVQATCQAGTKSQAAFQATRPVSASECGSIANGACQRTALASTNTPCGAYLYFGFRACSGRQFTDMYRGRVVVGCRSATNL